MIRIHDLMNVLGFSCCAYVLLRILSKKMLGNLIKVRGLIDFSGFSPFLTASNKDLIQNNVWKSNKN